jgi:cell fate regulator YaaT (PSP1 superfamily)
MPHLIEVAFKGNRKDFFLWDPDELPSVKAGIIVDADRGEDLGLVHALGDLASHRNARAAHGYGDAPLTKKARRLATDDDLRRLTEVRAQDDDARRRGMERVKANQLAMKLTDAEWQWDRKKLTFYFTAEKRVDFRNLVRELAAMFRTRIELKQIGVRDEAKRLDGIGRCGRQYCSSSWLPELRPVNLGVAKDQRLSLNPSQISGACGRLMCCLRYEHEFYVQQRKRFPKEGKVIRTSRGEEKIVSNDIFRERVTLRGVDGELRLVPLVELRQELDGLGGAFHSALPVAGEELDGVDAMSATAVMIEEHHESEVQEELHHEVADPHPPAMPAPAPTQTAARPASDAPSDSKAPVAEGERATAESTSDQKKPHRRRGRRGGRRNRAAGNRDRAGEHGASESGSGDDNGSSSDAE